MESAIFYPQDDHASHYITEEILQIRNISSTLKMIMLVITLLRKYYR